MKKPDRAGFTPLQAQEVNRAFQRAGVDYLFIGKSGAILLGYPSTTQDVDLFVPKSETNGRKVIRALSVLGFTLSLDIREAILTGKDFIQIKSGPFDLDLVHAPDGIPSYEIAKGRSLNYQGYPVASLRDIIASKRASNRAKDMVDLELLEEFRREFERMNSAAIETAADKALRRSTHKKRQD
jgi:hypothetical protein